MPLTDYQRRRIVSLHNLSEGKMTKTAIQKKLEAEGIYTTRQTVANTIARFQATGLVEDRHRSGRPRSVTEDMYRFIDEAMAEDDEEGIKKYWAGLTPDVCSRYIQHLQKVLPEVLKCDGGPTGH